MPYKSETPMTDSKPRKTAGNHSRSATSLCESRSLNDATNPMNHKEPEDMDDAELYGAYQTAKEHGSMLRIDELQLEIAQRWEDNHRVEVEA